MTVTSSLDYYLTVSGLDGGGAAQGHLGAFDVADFSFDIDALASLRLDDVFVTKVTDTTDGVDHLELAYKAVSVTTTDQHHNGTLETQTIGWDVATGTTFTTPLVAAVAGDDQSPPTLTPVADQTDEATSAAGAVATFSATATDAVDGNVQVVFKEGNNVVQSGQTFSLGQHTITETATDGAHNIGTASFTITVQDTTAPAISSASDQTVEATSAAGAAVTFSATATDAVDGNVQVVFNEGNNVVQSGQTFSLGQHTTTETPTDSAHNIGTASFTITVQDTTAPAISSASDQTVEATSAAGAAVAFSATATDAVAGNVPVLFNERNNVVQSGQTLSLVQHTITETATDSAHNIGTASFTITVQDNQAGRANYE